MQGDGRVTVDRALPYGAVFSSVHAESAQVQVRGRSTGDSAIARIIRAAATPAFNSISATHNTGGEDPRTNCHSPWMLWSLGGVARTMV